MKMKNNLMTSPVLAALLLAATAAAALPAEPSFVPWPKTVQMQPGSMTLGAGGRILTDNAALDPLARILAGEILLRTGLRLATGTGQPGPGDIGIALDPALTNEAHRVTVTDKTVVQGGNYVGAGMGTATLLQAIRIENGKATLPALASRRLGDVENTHKGARFTYGFAAVAPAADQSVRLRLAGRHQVDNAVTALRAAEVWLGLKPEENAQRHLTMLAALGRTRWPGRGWPRDSGQA